MCLLLLQVMRYIADGNWEFVTVLDAAPAEISYRYALVRERGEPLVEGGAACGRLLDVLELVKRGFGVVSEDEAVGLGPMQVEVGAFIHATRKISLCLVLAATRLVQSTGSLSAITNTKKSDTVCRI
jgi:hypothetical protein